MQKTFIGLLDRRIKSIRIIKKINNEYRYDVESMLYAFADKFLDGKDLEKVKDYLEYLFCFRDIG